MKCEPVLKMWSLRSPEVASDKAEAVGVGHESLAHLRQLPHSSATLPN